MKNLIKFFTSKSGFKQPSNVARVSPGDLIAAEEKTFGLPVDVDVAQEDRQERVPGVVGEEQQLHRDRGDMLQIVSERFFNLLFDVVEQSRQFGFAHLSC